MGAIGDRVLKDLGYDPNYRIGYTGNVDRTSYKPQAAAPSAGGYVGSVLSSIRSGVQSGAGAVGGFLHKSLVEEPTALAKYVGGNLQRYGAVPGKAIGNYQQYLKDKDINAYMERQRGVVGEGINAFRGSFGIIPSKELVQKGLPVGLTAASVALPFLKGGAVAAKAPEAVSEASNLARVGNAATKFVGQTVTGSGRVAAGFTNPVLNTAVKAGSGLAYNALVTRPTIESLVQAPGNIGGIAHGENVGANALNLGGIAAPAILTGGQKVIKAGKGIAQKAFFNTAGVFDNIKLKDGKSVNQAFKEFSSANIKSAPKQVKKVENELRVMQDLALQEAGGNAELAAQNMARYQSELNQFGKLDLPQFVDQSKRLIKARIAAQAAGFDTVARLTVADRAIIKNRLRQADDMAAELVKLRKEKVIKNDNLYGQLQDMVATGDKKLVQSQLKDLIAANPALKNGKALELGNGYFAIKQKSAGVVRNAQETGRLVEGTNARFGKVGDTLRKVGLSPEDVTAQDNQFAFNKFKETFQGKIDGIDGKSGQQLYKSLNKVADESLGVTDIRQLGIGKVASELNITKAEARQIIKAAKDSYKVLSVSERGLAGKLMDFNLRVNPIAAPYSRAQSILRYEKNPFFRLQENLETRFGVAAMGGKQVRPLSGHYDETIKQLNQRGIFTSGYGAEGADSFSGSFNGVKAKLSRDQQANIAASIEKFAGGPDKVSDWLRNPKNADLLNDFKTVVQYPDKGFTSSNLAKMMNLVAFPSRYNLKVTQFAIKQFAKQPAPVQIATIRALGDFNEFAKSPEGIKWQADNKEIIGLLKYFTPVMPIASVYDTITGKNKTLGDIGLIGGLPFGVITRVLTGQGILKDSTPYVDPKTGKVYSDRVPEDMKARAKSFLDSIVDTLYTYPGRSAGMETSKKQLTEGLANNLSFGQLKDGKYKEVDRSGDATPEQQRQSQILQSLSKPGAQSIRSNGAPTLTPIKAPASIKPAPIYKAKKAKKGKTKFIARPIGSL